MRKTTLGLALAVLSVSLMASAYVMSRARLAEARAEQLSDFLVRLLDVPDPVDTRGNSITARGILDRAATRIEQELEDRPLVQARLAATMGNVYKQLGLYRQAKPLVRRALGIRRRLLGDDDPDTLKTVDSMGQVLHYQGQLLNAEPYYREALEGRRRVLGDGHLDTLLSIRNVGMLLVDQARWEEARQYYLEALEGFRRAEGHDHPHTLDMMSHLGDLYMRMNKHEEAEALLAAAIEGLRRSASPNEFLLGVTMGSYGRLLAAMGRLDEAANMLLDSYEMLAATAGDDHEQTVIAVEALVAFYESSSRPAAADAWRAKLAGLHVLSQEVSE